MLVHAASAAVTPAAQALLSVTAVSVKAIFDGLSWLELFADEEPVFQHAQADRHREVVDQLLELGAAYRDFTSAEETGRLRDEASPPAIRLGT